MLRMEIQNLLLHRSRFKEILDALLEKLKEGKALILEIIEQATSAYENRFVYISIHNTIFFSC